MLKKKAYSLKNDIKSGCSLIVIQHLKNIELFSERNQLIFLPKLEREID